ncbi:TPA: hypothetical protein N0F65_011828 [Lagenidium giganteum]|uniref:Nitrogen permease regulator 2 n=1 Tax=Lagenidium giganteum TaxID=4803 RepID=A0AAV2YY25_9STRA|nr:TPA: hypothetical protein N0F65_011828 [Lagenidium giganteum]
MRSVVLTACGPRSLLSNETFDSVSGYIIIDKALCGKIITVCVQNMKIVGYPVCIEDDKYHRNALLFNIGALSFHETKATTTTTDTCPAIVSHRLCLRPERRDGAVSADSPQGPKASVLGSLMESMEKESGFLSKGETKGLLDVILPEILNDLTLNGECTIPVDSANVINLKLFPTLQDPAQVFDYQVPVAVRDLRSLLENSGALSIVRSTGTSLLRFADALVLDCAAEWDLALQQIVPFIDGVNYVKRISIEADVEIAIVKKCIRQLLYYGCITMIDIFLHSNIYATTPKISSLAADPKLQAECAMYITKSGRNPPSFAKIFALYCSMQPSLRMSDFCVVYAESLANIDVRRFITFGLIHSFLRRVHRYPIHIDRNNQQRQTLSAASSPPPAPVGLTPPTATTQGVAGSNPSATLGNPKRSMASVKASQFEKELLKMMDGDHHTDEICSTLMIRYADLEGLISKDPNWFIVHK